MTDIASDKKAIYRTFPLFLHENIICCGYFLEAPHRGAYNEYPHHRSKWRTGEQKYHQILLLNKSSTGGNWNVLFIEVIEIVRSF